VDGLQFRHGVHDGDAVAAHNHHVDTTMAPPVTNTEITERVHT
jgi:hypothetical protein